MNASETSEQRNEDQRLYLARSENWQAHLKVGWEKLYCYAKFPGEDYFHLLMNGEIYLKHGDEKYCLACACRMGILTTDRLHWQHRPANEQKKPLV